MSLRVSEIEEHKRFRECHFKTLQFGFKAEDGYFNKMLGHEITR